MMSPPRVDQLSEIRAAGESQDLPESTELAQLLKGLMKQLEVSVPATSLER